MKTLTGSRRFVILLLSLLCFSVLSSRVNAQLGNQYFEIPFVAATKVVFDEKRNFLYASITNQNQVAVIDLRSKGIVTMIPTAPEPVGVAISDDRRLLYVASAIAPLIEVIDLNRLQPAGTINLNVPAFDIVTGNNNYLYASPAVAPNAGIMQIDLTQGVLKSEFNLGRNIAGRSLLAQSPTRLTLFVASSKSAPGTLNKFYLLDDNPTFAGDIPPGSLGDFGLDVATSTDGKSISYITESFWQTGVDKLNVNGLRSTGLFNTGPGASHMAYGPFNKDVFIANRNGILGVYDYMSNNQLNTFPIPPTPIRDLLISPTGNHLFIAYEDGLRGFELVNSAMPINAAVFPDPAMQGCLFEQAEINNWQFVEEVTHLNCSGRNITDISGLELFSRLRHLDLSNNRIEASILSPLPQTLISLDLSKNQLFDVNFLQGLNELESFSIGDNPIFDAFQFRVSIQQLPKLKKLNIAGLQFPTPEMQQLFSYLASLNQVTDLDASRTQLDTVLGLHKIRTLKVLDLSETKLNSIAPLQELTQLRQLNLASVKQLLLSELPTVLDRMRFLTHLDLSNIDIRDLNQIPMFNAINGQPRNLVSLKLANTGISDLRSLEILQETLDTLDVRANNITSLQGVLFNNRLRNLDVSANSMLDVFQLSQVVANNTGLTHLALADIPLLDLNFLPLFNPQTGKPYNLIKLNLHNTGISDLNPIAVMNNLEVLDLSDNGISDVQALMDMPLLKELDLSNNALTNVFVISQMLSQKPLLSKLGLAYAPIEDLNFLSLIDPQTGWPKPLRSLNLAHTGVRDINALSQLVTLKELDLSGNNIADINPLMNLSGITNLNLSGNNLINGQDLAAVISNKTGLTHLGMADIKIPNLDMLPFNTVTPQGSALLELDISNTGITDINHLAQYPSLRKVNISHNKLIDLAPLSQLNVLQQLDLSYTNVSTLQALFNMSELQTLKVSGNFNLSQTELDNVLIQNVRLKELHIADIPFNIIQNMAYFSGAVPNSELQTLNLANSGLNDLNFIIHFPKIRNLALSGNNIQDLNMLQNLQLNRLDISNNNLFNSAALESLRGLVALDISNNTGINLPSINIVLSNNPGLQELGLAGLNLGDLNSLPLRTPQGMPYSLKRIDISNTGITFIDRLSEFRGLRIIDVSNNNLFALQGLDFLENVRELNIANTGISDLFNLNNYRMLERIDLSDNNPNSPLVQEFNQMLQQNLNLKRIGLANLAITDLNQLTIPPAPFPAQSAGWTELVLDKNPLQDVNLIGTMPSLERLSLRSIPKVDTKPLLNLNDPKLIDLRDSIGFACAQFDELENRYGTDVVKRATTCGQDQPPVNYCTANGSNTNYEWIDKVSFVGINSVSGNNFGYLDQTATVFNIMRGFNYPLTVNPGFKYGSYYEHWRVWIDYNADGQFTADEEVLASYTNSSTTQFIVIPNTAKPGKTRMRVAMRWGNPPTACGLYTWGEVEDYTVNIQ